MDDYASLYDTQELPSLTAVVAGAKTGIDPSKILLGYCRMAEERENTLYVDHSQSHKLAQRSSKRCRKLQTIKRVDILQVGHIGNTATVMFIQV
jgi:hypothetical protein